MYKTAQVDTGVAPVSVGIYGNILLISTPAFTTYLLKVQALYYSCPQINLSIVHSPPAAFLFTYSLYISKGYLHLTSIYK